MPFSNFYVSKSNLIFSKLNSKPSHDDVRVYYLKLSKKLTIQIRNGVVSFLFKTKKYKINAQKKHLLNKYKLK